MNTPGERSAGSLHHSVAAVYGASFIMGAISVTFAASSQVLRTRLGIGDTLYGALFLPWYGLAILIALMAPWFLRRWSLRGLFLTGLAMQPFVLLCFAGSIYLPRPLGLALLIVGLLLFSLGAGTSGITMNTAAGEIFPRARSGALSALHALLAIGAASWPLVIALAIRAGHWIIAPLALALIVAVLVLVGRRRPIQGLAAMRIPEHGRTDIPPRLLGRAATVLIYGIWEATLTAWAVIYATEDLQLPVTVGASALSCFWIAMAGGRLAGMIVMRRSSAVRLAYILLLGVVIAFAIIARAANAMQLLTGYALGGIASSAIFPIMLGLAADEQPARLPQVTAVFSVAVVLGLAAGAFGVGPLRAHVPLEHIMRFSALWPLVLGGILCALNRR